MSDQTPPGPPPGWNPASAPPPPGPPPGYGYGYAPAQHEHPQGTAVLVLGILGFVSCGLLGPIAWIMGNKALAEIDAHPGYYSNRGNVATLALSSSPLHAASPRARTAVRARASSARLRDVDRLTSAPELGRSALGEGRSWVGRPDGPAPRATGRARSPARTLRTDRRVVPAEVLRLCER